ncbi:MAG TPA: SRPBCC family protein [Chloroflexota bacterium]|jgi:hypothetical protein
MLRVVESALIERPVAELFAIAADPFKQLAWDPGTLKSVEKLGAGPLGRGARYRGTFKGFGVVEYDYADYDPPRRFSHRTRLKMGEMRHTFTFEAVPGGARLTQEGELRPNLLGWLLQPLMARMLRKRFREIADELRAYAATARPAAGAPASNSSAGGIGVS